MDTKQGRAPAALCLVEGWPRSVAVPVDHGRPEDPHRPTRSSRSPRIHSDPLILSLRRLWNVPFAIPVAGLVLPTPSVSLGIGDPVDRVFEPGEGGFALSLCRAARVQDNNSISSFKVVDIGLSKLHKSTSMGSSGLCCVGVRVEPRRAKRKDPRDFGLRAQAQATNTVIGLYKRTQTTRHTLGL